MTQRIRRILKGPKFPLGAMVFAYGLSLFVSTASRPEFDGRIFFYPDNSRENIRTERRGIPYRKDFQEQVTVFLTELLLGPVALDLAPAVPRGIGLRHAAAVGKIVYVDLDLVTPESSSELGNSFDEALDIVDYNLRYNFPSIGEVVFTIEGNQAGAPYYQ